MPEQSKEELLIRAKLAEQADRHEDLAKIMKQMVEKHKDITAEERNLLSFAFKTIVGARRHSWRVVADMQKKLDNAEQQKWAKDYLDKIEVEMRGICNDVLSSLEKTLIPGTSDQVTKVFYIKMKADYLRYLAEISSGADRAGAVEKSRSAYSEAFEIAKEKMPPTNPIRLGLALNFSVFYYEIANAKEKACQLAKEAFDDALAGLTAVDEENHKDSTMIMQLLRDNLTLWTDSGSSDTEADHEDN